MRPKTAEILVNYHELIIKWTFFIDFLETIQLQKRVPEKQKIHLKADLES